MSSYHHPELPGKGVSVEELLISGSPISKSVEDYLSVNWSRRTQPIMDRTIPFIGLKEASGWLAEASGIFTVPEDWLLLHGLVRGSVSFCH